MGGAARERPRHAGAAPAGRERGRHRGRVPLVRGGAARRVRRAEPGRPGRPARGRSAAHGAAHRVPVGRGPVPLAGVDRRGAARLPAGAAADGAAAAHGAPADLGRRRYRQDGRGGPDRQGAAGAGRGDPAGGAVLPRAGRAVAGGTAGEVRHRRRTGAGVHGVAPGAEPGAGAVAVRQAPVHDHLDGLHQVDPAPRGLRQALPRPGDRRRGAHLCRRRRRRAGRRVLRDEPAPLRAAAEGVRRRRPPSAAADGDPALRQGVRVPQPARPGAARAGDAGPGDAGGPREARRALRGPQARRRPHLPHQGGRSHRRLPDRADRVPLRPLDEGRAVQADARLPCAP